MYEFVALNQSRRVVTGPDRLLPLLPMVTSVNNGKLTYFVAISLPKIAGNEIYIYYATIRKLYTYEKSK